MSLTLLGGVAVDNKIRASRVPESFANGSQIERYYRQTALERAGQRVAHVSGVTKGNNATS